MVVPRTGAAHPTQNAQRKQPPNPFNGAPFAAKSQIHPFGGFSLLNTLHKLKNNSGREVGHGIDGI
jgi:hypothetical protein